MGLAGTAQAEEVTPGAKSFQWDLTLTREETKRAASGDLWAVAQYCDEIGAKLGGYWAGATAVGATAATWVAPPVAAVSIPTMTTAGGLIGGGTGLGHCMAKTIESAQKADAKGKRAGLTFQLPGMAWTWSF